MDRASVVATNLVLEIQNMVALDADEAQTLRTRFAAILREEFWDLAREVEANRPIYD
jgi:hypothetical protein